MNLLKRQKSIVDVIFMITVFGVFMLSALFVVLFGAKIYRRTAHDMSVNFNSRTALAYVTEKVHQHDRRGGVDITIKDGKPVLKLTQYINSDEYCTYLYEHGGYLKELTAKGDIDLVKSAGKEILKISEFTAQKENDSLYRFVIADDEGNETQFYVSLYSYTYGKGEETGGEGDE
ncbi:MAG: DUF4860 domain-containing protein [Lachnospiraceae bacterium]|nr:DUF4860 domain-containing protein [Lachnospiraceae bacterium]